MHSKIVRTAAESFFSRCARSSGVACKRKCVDLALHAVRPPHARPGQPGGTYRANPDRLHPAVGSLL